MHKILHTPGPKSESEILCPPKMHETQQSPRGPTLHVRTQKAKDQLGLSGLVSLARVHPGHLPDPRLLGF